MIARSRLTLSELQHTSAPGSCANSEVSAGLCHSEKSNNPTTPLLKDAIKMGGVGSGGEQVPVVCRPARSEEFPKPTQKPVLIAFSRNL